MYRQFSSNQCRKYKKRVLQKNFCNAAAFRSKKSGISAWVTYDLISYFSRTKTCVKNDINNNNHLTTIIQLNLR